MEIVKEESSSWLCCVSHLVPSVQELAKKPITTLPPRYIQQDLHDGDARDQVNKIGSNEASSSIQPEIPTINFKKLLSRKESNSFQDSDELARLHLASKEWGFFQLVNHGVSSSLLEKIKTEIQDFFNLSIDEKKRFWQRPEDMEGFGQLFVVSEEQKLDWADVFFMTTLPVQMRKPHLFPELPSPFKDTLEIYSLELNNLAMAILTQMEHALKVDANELTELFEDGMQSMRMNYYPPCPQPEKVIGFTPHSDASGLTILLQVNELEGLQIKKDGNWLPVKPLPEAFIVNIGDALEIKTNGTYRSIEHRAIVNSEKERLSIATFCNPRVDGEIGPASSLITEQTPAAYTRIGVQDYTKAFFARKIQGKSFIDDLKV
ncbi:PREDICTED: protein SRG1-like [Fragaria vesca subsp. vesca]|uniref:protein SRG1-like n=1 Tax=Fragaria vesca subsp. vesca TaxID=101020 RepID=UPI0002C3649E|nr:PREDICTED: protein SRG1-like [Fragaria vesca subsp. vesca]